MAPRDEAALEDRRGRLGVLPDGRSGLHRVVGDHLVEVATAHDVSERRQVGMLGPLELERDAVRERAEAVEAVEVRESLAEAHVVELPHRSGREPVAARLLARERLLLDEEDIVTRRREPVRGRGARRATADHEHLVMPGRVAAGCVMSGRVAAGCVAAARGRHQDPVAWPAAPSVVHCAGTGFWPDSTTRS